MNLTSPSFPSGFTSNRTEAEARGARSGFMFGTAAALCEAASIRRPTIPTTQFVLYAQWPREVRLRSIEWELIETAAEAIEAIRQNDHIVQVIRVDNDAPCRDVSEDIARAYLTDWIARGGNPEEDDMPDFIESHVGREEAIRIFSEDYSMARAI